MIRKRIFFHFFGVNFFDHFVQKDRDESSWYCSPGKKEESLFKSDLFIDKLLNEGSRPSK